MKRSEELKYNFMRKMKLRNYADSTISTYSGCLSVILDKYKQYNGYKDVEEIKSLIDAIEMADQYIQQSFSNKELLIEAAA